MNIELKKQLTVLELGDLVSVIERQEKDVSLIHLNYNDRLEHLLTELITEKQNRLIARLTKNAELKYPNASLETLDCEARGINRDMIVNLASMGFVSAATNLIITGATGAGYAGAFSEPQRQSQGADQVQKKTGKLQGLNH